MARRMKTSITTLIIIRLRYIVSFIEFTVTISMCRFGFDVKAVSSKLEQLARLKCVSCFEATMGYRIPVI